MKRYRRLKAVLFALVVGYFFAGYAVVFGGLGYVYPVEAWMLFASVPDTQERPALVLTAVADGPLDAPVRFQEAGPLVRDAGEIRAQYAIRGLADALRRGDDRAIADARGFVETAYLEPGTAYRVVVERYEPLDRYRDPAAYEVVEVLGAFRVDPPNEGEAER